MHQFSEIDSDQLKSIVAVSHQFVLEYVTYEATARVGSRRSRFYPNSRTYIEVMDIRKLRSELNPRFQGVQLSLIFVSSTWIRWVYLTISQLFTPNRQNLPHFLYFLHYAFSRYTNRHASFESHRRKVDNLIRFSHPPVGKK